MVGILALQGDVDAHAKALARLGVLATPVRTEDEIARVDALVLPGGESTTMWKLMEGTGIPSAIREVAASGRPIFGTCAGAILLATRVLTSASRSDRASAEGAANPERPGLGLLPVTVVRNAYGRQLDSKVVTLTDVSQQLPGGAPLEAVFIRAPRLVDLGPSVEVLARWDGDPVLVRLGNVLVATFHPELTDDDRVLRLFLEGRGAERRAA